MTISNDDKRILLGLIWCLKPADLSILYAMLTQEVPEGTRPATTAVRHTGHEAFWRALQRLALAEEVDMKLSEETKTVMPDNVMSFALTAEGKKWVGGGWGLALGGGWPPREAVMADEAIDMLQRYAAENVAISQSKLASLYQIGAGVEKDLRAAMAWYKKAAEQDEPTALNNLGIMYFAGEGVDKDLDVARRFFERAADAGSAGAMDNMGELYTQGIGVEKDDTKALGWFLRAAARGHGLAMCKTGLCFLNGQGTSPDPLEAYIWLQKGVENGYNVTDHRDAAAAKLTPDQLAEAEKRLVAERAKAAGTA